MDEERPIDPKAIRKAFGAMQETVKRLLEQDALRTKQINDLQERIGGLETLNIACHGKEAVEFHQATEKNPTIKQARAILGGTPIEGVEKV